MLAISLVLALLAAAGLTVGFAPGRASDEPPATTTVTVNVPARYRGGTAEHWAARFRHRTRQLQEARALTRTRWAPTVTYALRLAAAVSGLAYTDLRTVATCESGLYPFAENGQYKGIFQMHWLPFGFSPFDPVANALSAALTVVHDGSWRQWECKP